MPPYLIVLIVGLNMLTACKNSKSQVATSTEENISGFGQLKTNTIIRNQTNIPPQYCRLIGMIVEIEKIVDKQTRGCKIGPCYAMIKIEQVLGYGSSFPSSFQSGAEITVFFPSSLNSTDHLPGLKKGDSFRADMEGAITLSNQPTYTIYSYELE